MKEREFSVAGDCSRTSSAAKLVSHFQLEMLVPEASPGPRGASCVAISCLVVGRSGGRCRPASGRVGRVGEVGRAG